MLPEELDRRQRCHLEGTSKERNLYSLLKPSGKSNRIKLRFAMTALPKLRRKVPLASFPLCGDTSFRV